MGAIRAYSINLGKMKKGNMVISTFKNKSIRQKLNGILSFKNLYISLIITVGLLQFLAPL